MSLQLNQLIQPQGVQYWTQQLINALQGIGYVTQSAPTPQIQGTGTVSPSGPATQAAGVVVGISTSGNVGTGYFQYSTDNGVTFSGALLIPAGSSGSSGSYLIAAIGVTLTFTNGTYFTPGNTSYFIAGEQYNFSTSVPTFPVTNWEPGSVAWSLIQSDAQALADLSLTQAQVAAGGFTQSWITPPTFGPPPDGYCDLLSQNIYNRQRIQGGSTTGLVVLSNAGSTQTISVGQLLIASATGQQFTNTTGGSLTGGGTLTITIQAVQSGAGYNDIPTYDPNNLIPGGNYITNLISPLLPGVSVSNPINSGPTVVHAGTGPTGVTFTGTATSAFNIIFAINSTGSVGTSTYSYSLDSGNTFIFVGVTASTGITLNGMVVGFSAGTYVEGDTYSASTGWITTYGSNTQSSLSLATADQNQWTQLAPSSPSGTYSNWAISASPEVVECFVSASLNVPGGVNLVLVGQNNGPVSLSAVAAVTAYVQARLGINDSVSVASVIPVIASVTATNAGIQIHSAQAASVYAGISAALFKLQSSIPPGNELFLDEVEVAIVQVPGVIQIVPGTLELNGIAANIPLNPNEVVSILAPPSSSYSLL